MRQPELRDTQGVEALLDRYTTTRLAPNSSQLARGRTAMLAASESAGPMAAGPRPVRRPFVRGWSFAAGVVLIVAASSGLVAAESGPGQPFYGLRLAIGALTLPGDGLAHERGLAGQLDDRLSEVRAAARTGDGRGALAAVQEYLRTLRELARNGVSDPAILALLQRHQSTLRALLSVAPAQATDGVQEALDAARDVNGVVAPTRSAVPHPTPPQDAGQSPPDTGKP